MVPDTANFRSFACLQQPRQQNCHHRQGACGPFWGREGAPYASHIVQLSQFRARAAGLAIATLCVVHSHFRTRARHNLKLHVDAVAVSAVGGSANSSSKVDVLRSDVNSVVTRPAHASQLVPLACPVCQHPIARGTFATNIECRFCGIVFPWDTEGHFMDLTVAAAMPEAETAYSSRTAAQPMSVATFQNPFVSFAYERGWRSSFAIAGFPGVEEEFRLAQDFLASVAQGVLLDASCGSGLFSRRFASSGRYGAVVALDFSKSMLCQADEYAKHELGEEYWIDPEDDVTPITSVRGDIARLPFVTGSLDGVYAGAAIHCWPSPEISVAEVARVLRPGGSFVLSTFRPRGLLYHIASIFPKPSGFRFWEEQELRSLTRQCGLVEFEAILREPAFIMVHVRKPVVPD